MPHWRRQYRAGPGWVERGTAALLGWLGLVGYCAILLFGLWLIFATTPKAKAEPACQQGQIKGLADLARDLGVKPSTNPGIASGIGCDGKPYDIVELIRAHVDMMKRVKK